MLLFESNRPTFEQFEKTVLFWTELMKDLLKLVVKVSNIFEFFQQIF